MILQRFLAAALPTWTSHTEFWKGFGKVSQANIANWRRVYDSSDVVEDEIYDLFSDSEDDVE